MNRKAASWIALLLAISFALPVSLQAATIAVIGTGRVGGALGPRFADLGHEVIYGSRNPNSDAVQTLIGRSESARATTPADAAAAAEIIVLAIPWRAAQSVIGGFKNVAGKTIIDVTNALTVGEDGLMTMAVDTSAGELIQSWLPQCHVVKAFNAVGYQVMADPSQAGGPVTIPIAGDNVPAKTLVAEMVGALGFEVVDVGPIKHARHLEGMAVLYMVPYMTGKRDEVFEFYFRQSESLHSNREVRPAN